MFNSDVAPLVKCHFEFQNSMSKGPEKAELDEIFKRLTSKIENKVNILK